jgi:PIN domain nuclease of toxin-antitoxin system
MSRFLLDTHAFLWWLEDNARLKQDARGAIADRTFLVHVSAATILEIAIKTRLGRLKPGTKKMNHLPG